MKHCTYIAHQDKMAVPTEVSKNTLTFEPDMFRKNAIYNCLKFDATMVSLVLFVIARTTRIACRLTDRQTHTHTHTQDTQDTQNNYCSPHCACAPRVKESKLARLNLVSTQASIDFQIILLSTNLSSKSVAQFDSLLFHLFGRHFLLLLVSYLDFLRVLLN